MKFYDKDGGIEVVWSDHKYNCAKCSEVEIGNAATFVKSCAIGAQLIMEELKKQQAPIQREKDKKIEEQAKQAGTFIKSRVKDARAITRYK